MNTSWINLGNRSLAREGRTFAAACINLFYTKTEPPVRPPAERGRRPEFLPHGILLD